MTAINSKTPFLTQKTDQQPVTVTYTDRYYNKPRTITLEVGGGATEQVGSDAYPFTVWGWYISPSGQITVFCTRDNEHDLPGNDYYSENNKYTYTSNEPSKDNPAEPYKLGAKNCRLTVGKRRYHRDPHR